MSEKPWDELTDPERIARLLESTQNLFARYEAVRDAYREQAERIRELEDRLATLESHQP